MLVTFTRALLLAIGVLGSAATLSAAPETPEERIVARLKQARPGLTIGDVRASPMQGIYQVQIEQGPLIYTSADGRHFLTGDMFEVGVGGLVNIAERQRQGERISLLENVNENDMIVFSPAGAVKGTVTVFTDVDCFYCQKLHKEVPELNRLGIKVRYLAYPRAGLGSASYRKIATAWCATDPRDAITRLKAREVLPENVCADNPIASQFLLGQRVGVTGTPALLLEDGTLLPGYMPADQLAERIGAS